MKLTTPHVLLTICAAVAFVGPQLPVCAFPCPTPVQAVRGLFPKVRLPRVNFGKGAKALLYPVTKATVNGGKTVVQGGTLAVKGAQKGVEIYGATRSLSNKTNGITGAPHLP